MGTWGVHSFENDDAMEWCQAYREMGLFVAKSTIDVALNDVENAHLGADIACRAIAAVEAVCHVLGTGTPEAAEAFQGAPEADREEAEALVSSCNHVIMAITGGSELSVLWKEAEPGQYDAWIASLTDLRTRVNGGSSDAEAAESAAERPAPVRQAADVSLQDQLVDIRNAIGGLEHDIEAMRQEMREGMIELAKRIAGQGR